MTRTSKRIGLLAAAAFFLLEWIRNGFFGYGIFRDELYFIACTKRLALGYVDHPPLSIWILRAALLVGSSLPVIRLLPALAGAATIFLAVRLTDRLGGSPRALVAAAVASAGSPVILLVSGFYSMNALEVLIVTALVTVAFEIVSGANPRLWLAFGILTGLAVLNKHTAAVYVLAILGGVAVSPGRRLLLSPWLAAGGLCALLIVSPNAYWEIREHWLSLAFYKNATLMKNIDTPAWKVVQGQALASNPAALPLLIAGLYAGSRRDSRTRFIAVAYSALVLLLMFSRSSRPDRVAAMYPALFAVGAAQLDHVSRRFTLAAASFAAFGAVALAPIGVPLLPPNVLASYANTLGIVPKVERFGASFSVPQWFGDRFAWDEVARAALQAARELSPQEQEHTLVVGSNYGDSSSVEYFAGDALRVAGRHNAWHAWKFAEPEPTTLLLIGFNEEVAARLCGRFTVGARYTRPYTAEVDAPVFVCRDLKMPLADAWPGLRMLL